MRFGHLQSKLSEQLGLNVPYRLEEDCVAIGPELPHSYQRVRVPGCTHRIK